MSYFKCKGILEYCNTRKNNARKQLQPIIVMIVGT